MPFKRISSKHSIGDTTVEDALQEDCLWLLGAHVCVGGLLRDEDATDLAQLLVHLVHLHLDSALADVEDLVRLLEELLLPFLAIGDAGSEADGLIVAGVHAAALRVQEATTTVGGHHVLATPLEALLELA